MSKPYFVRYADSQDGVVVSIIRTWVRGEITPVASASSGLKDYVKNMIHLAFEANPLIETITMVMGQRASTPPFLIMRIGTKYFDVTAKEVEVTAA